MVSAAGDFVYAKFSEISFVIFVICYDQACNGIGVVIATK